MEAKDVLKVMIKYSGMESDVFPVISSMCHNDVFEKAEGEFKLNYRHYAHRYLALANIWHSLINNVNYVDIGFKLVEAGGLIPSEYKDDEVNIKKWHHRFEMTFNETCTTLLFIQYSKLAEALWDPAAKNNNIISEKKKYVDDLGLSEVYAPLGELVRRIRESNIREIRNNVFAHPFKMDREIRKKGEFVSLSNVVDKINSSIMVLVDACDKPKLIESGRPFRYYIRTYMVDDRKAIRHLHSLFLYMDALKEKTLIGITPDIFRPSEDAKICAREAMEGIVR